MILTQDPISFISKQKRGQEEKIVERQRERGRECECRLREDVASVVKWTVRKYMCFIN